jgi:hypothetical protein
MSITRDEIMAARTDAGGWTKAQLAEWNVPWPPAKGWISKLVEDSKRARWQLEHAARHLDIATGAIARAINCDERVNRALVGELARLTIVVAATAKGIE